MLNRGEGAGPVLGLPHPLDTMDLTVRSHRDQRAQEVT
jgi:hypothetical protein